MTTTSTPLPTGFQASGLAAGIKKSGKPDLALIYSEQPATVAGAFTKNRVRAAGVHWCEHLCATRATVRAIVVNSGNANACTGQRGHDDTRTMAATVAEALGLEVEDVLVSSTGIIGEPLPIDHVVAGIRRAADALSGDGGAAAARAIMTTDLVPKSATTVIDLDGVTVRVTGITKGSGMIDPHLQLAPHATMLAYLVTDARCDAALLSACLAAALPASFNKITVDGDSSTNDTVLLLANGAAGNAPLQPDSAAAAKFRDAVIEVAADLARQIVLDGEGATRFVTVSVTGAVDDDDARRCAEAIANSLLCKTAWFGGDPNWGRVLCAAGYSGAVFAPEAFALAFNNVAVMRDGTPLQPDHETLLTAVSGAELTLDISLGDGPGRAEVWTCDLSYDYVKINGEYHT